VHYTTPSTTLVVAWGGHRYIRNERYRNNKVKYEEKERKPHDLLNSFRFELIILASLTPVTDRLLQVLQATKLIEQNLTPGDG